MDADTDLIFISLIYRAIEEGYPTNLGFLQVAATERELAMINHGDQFTLDNYHWRVTGKNIDKKCFFFKSSPPHPAATKNVEIYPPPSHLVDLLKIDFARVTSTEVKGWIKCICGTEIFIPRFLGEVVEQLDEQRVRPLVTGEHLWHSIEAECINCEMNHLIYDRNRHGLRGIVRAENSDTNEDSPPVFLDWHCEKCKTTTHELELFITGPSKEDSLASQNDLINEENWADCFKWMGIRVRCSMCGYRPSLWTGSS